MPYEDPTLIPPDPAFVLQLPDEVLTGSNLYAVQKMFDGPFSFDIFFESASAKQKLTCQCFLWLSPALILITLMGNSRRDGQRDC